MQDFWVNQHAESSHRTRPLPKAISTIAKGVSWEIDPTSPFSPNTSTRELDMELTPKELHQLRERWRVISPLKQYMPFDKDFHWLHILFLEERKGLGFKPNRVQVGTPAVPSLPMSLKSGGANQLNWSARCDETICRNPVPRFPSCQI